LRLVFLSLGRERLGLGLFAEMEQSAADLSRKRCFYYGVRPPS